VAKSDFYAKGYYSGLAPEPRFEAVLRIARTLKCERLLDIGCGDGTFTVLLKETVKAREAVGIEIAPEAVSIAKRKGIEAYQVDIDGNTLPFESGGFDVVYCGEIIEHIFNPDLLMDEVRRVMKAGGSAIFTTPNLAGWPNRLALLLGYQPYPTAASPEHEGVGKLIMKGDEGQWGHIRVFTLRALKELLGIHHFRVVRLEGCPVTTATPFVTTLVRLIGSLDRVMATFPPLATRIIAVVEKE
jgi:methionine biosynthesis protein MetW